MPRCSFFIPEPSAEFLLSESGWAPQRWIVIYAKGSAYFGLLALAYASFSDGKFSLKTGLCMNMNPGKKNHFCWQYFKSELFD